METLNIDEYQASSCHLSAAGCCKQILCLLDNLFAYVISDYVGTTCDISPEKPLFPNYEGNEVELCS